MDKLTASVTGTSTPITISVSDSHSAATATAMVTAISTNLIVGSSISISLGYNGNNTQVFEGYVKSVELAAPPKLYTIIASNEMIRAIDYFIVSSNPDEPYTWDHISAEDLVGEIFSLAGISNYHGDNSSFTFGVNNPVEVNLVGAYDFARMIADLLAWSIYAGPGGVCYFTDRKPYPMGGEGSSATLTKSNILNLKYSVSDRDLRNRVVVYGTDGVFAEASSPSPFLPTGFYKSVAVVSELLEEQVWAEQTATYNLAKLNRLTYNCNISTPGDPGISCRDCVDVVHDAPGLTDTWYVFGIEHSWGQPGFTTNLQLRR